MIDYFQDLIIAILNLIYSFVGRINKKYREIIVWVLYIIGFSYFIVLRSPLLNEKFFDGFLRPVANRHILGMALLLLIALFTMDGPLKRTEQRKFVLALQILTGIGVIVIKIGRAHV